MKGILRPKKWKRVLIILASILAIYAIIAFLPRPSNYSVNPMMRDFGSETPILIAHGGGNREFPDNTLEAFYNAYSVDSRVMMETDVSITKDGVLILSHDTTLDQKTNVTGNIHDWNYSDLIAERVDFGYDNETDENDRLIGERVKFKDYDGNEKLPTDVDYPDGISARDESIFYATTLEELLVAFPENRINVEIKQEGEYGLAALREALRILYKYDAFDRVVLASFHDEIYEEFGKLVKDGDVPNCFMYSPSTGGVVKFFILQTLRLDIFFADGICVLQIPMEEYGINLAKKSLIRCAHRHNIAVHYWTINDPEDMKHLIEIGADGIMTDRPHLLKEVYESMN